ncbi:MAG: NAD(P)-dependent oxidoreductase [Hyphomicrobium sp.]|jgi:citronellol/citronellal dehydrogenase|nr:NAD(P)-dependent oxidoreductase [Hyphomonas sp.]MCU0954030.1 NAD(P)-dependent oxidoreductase [Hyphomicrobium sp.]
MPTLKNKTLFITGASRGIGLAIALRAARDGANIAIAAKTADPNPKLPGTVYTAAAAIEAAGGRALPLVCDIRFEEQVAAAVAKTVETFGGIDACINNASALSPTGTEATTMKRFDLMYEINTRGTFLTTKTCVPYLRKAENPHVLVLSPPLDLRPKWFKHHVAYSIAKYGMSLCVLGMAEEFRSDGIAVNALWPRTAIATAAVENILGSQLIAMSRTPEIMADAAHLVLTQPAWEWTGRFLIDDSFLFEKGGLTDFDGYRVDATKPLVQDFFVPDDPPPPPGVEVVPLALPGA